MIDNYKSAVATDVMKTFKKHGFVPPSTLGFQKKIREKLNHEGFDEEAQWAEPPNKERKQ